MHKANLQKNKVLCVPWNKAQGEPVFLPQSTHTVTLNLYANVELPTSQDIYYK